MLRELLVGARQQTVGPVLGEPRVVGRDVVGDVVEDQPEAPRGELLARVRERVAAAEARVDRVVAHAVRRADHVLVAQIGERRAVAGVELGVGPRDLEARRAALPDAHQPHGVDRQRRERVPLGVAGTWSSVSARAGARVAAEPPQPDRGVDLVHGRAPRAVASRRPAHSPTIATASCSADTAPGEQEQQRHGPGPAGLVAGADPGTVVAVEVLVEQQQVVPVGIALELLDPAEHRPAPVLVLGEGRRQPSADLARDLEQVQLVSPEPVGHSTVSRSP